MKEIRPAHIAVAVLLVLLSWAIVHWVILPKEGMPKTAEFSTETKQHEELPVLPQNELYKSQAAAPLKELPSFQSTEGQDSLEPKPATASKKEEL